MPGFRDSTKPGAAQDCHTGEPPAPDSEVSVDHWVVLGTDEAPEDWGEPVEYGNDMRQGLRALLPDAVVGRYVGGTLPNGDFAIDHRDLLSGDLDRIRRVRPVGARGPAGRGVPVTRLPSTRPSEGLGKHPVDTAGGSPVRERRQGPGS
jgi:hypothetical protein